MNSNDLPPYDQLEPALLWKFFAGIASIPRPSGKEERVREHVRARAVSRGFATGVDAAGNLLIRVPATSGLEKAPVTVLQGHLDMVCEKNSGTAHDFDRDPIRLAVDRYPEDGGLIVRAEGTTLGADNGIGLSLALAAAASPEVAHGPLEILCTVDEEVGMGGARQLEPSFLQGRRMLNLDSEENALYIGCAGGCNANLSWDFETDAIDPALKVARIGVSGLMGGHSGGDIHLNRANAIRILARLLLEAGGSGLRLIEFQGGSKRNAIPRESFAMVAAPAEALGALRQAAERIQAEAVNSGDPSCRIQVDTQTSNGLRSGPAERTAHFLRTLIGLPSGVLGVVPEIPGLVETSNNVSTVITQARGQGGFQINVGCMARSSSMPRLRAVARQIDAVGRLGGAEVVIDNEYPGWKPNLNSPLLELCRRVYKEMHGQDPKVTAIHAGLECGIIGDRIPGMDMVSLGPDIRGAHSPDERVYVESVQRTWGYLKALLRALAEG